MSYLIDLHTHTIVSGHAYSTIKEMAKRASEIGMTHLGFSEHGPKMPGSCHELYFHNLKIMPKELFGVKILYGAEVNIVDLEGKLDLRGGTMRKLDYIIASMHLPCVQPGTVEENTRAMIKAMENPLVSILGHPDDDRYPVDVERIVRRAKELNKLIEINNSSLSPNASRVGAENNVRVILEMCKEYSASVILGSDAHYEDYVGEFKRAEAILKEIDFPQDLVVNVDFKRIEKYLPSK